MNKLQQIEFEMLEAFVDVCEKLNLKYYLVCGSALGAVKYGGFIPWDDDIDVALPRSDYEIFCNEAQKYLPKHIFLQNYRTDKNFPSLGSKLRNSNTTYIEIPHKNLNMHQGVFIDVFPLDGVPEKHEDKGKIDIAKRKYIRRKAVKLHYERFKGRNLIGIRTNMMYLLYRLFGFYSNTNKYVKTCEEEIAKYHTSECNIWCNHVDYIPGKEHEPCEYYGEGAIAVFETLNVRIPEKYDEYLTQRYGDWRADIPEEEKVGHHYYNIMDLEHSYADYIEKVYRNGQCIKIRKSSNE